MRRTRQTLVVVAVAAALFAKVGAQAGRGLIDPNVARETELLALPHMTPGIVKALVARRPFMSVLELNAFLLEQKLTQRDGTDFYAKAFVQINLDTGTRAEFTLIPGAGTRMAREFAEYRPWKNWIQFDKEIGKYVGQPETDRFKMYVFIPIHLNTAPDEDLLSIPGVDHAMLRTLKSSRPWKSKDQFDKEVGKDVGAKEAARLWRYLVIP